MTDQTQKYQDVDQIVAAVLGLNPAELNDELSYQSIHQWDSLSHVDLMLALEKQYQCKISQDLLTELVTVKALRHWAAGAANRAAPAPVPAPAQGPVLYRGLNGIHFDSSRITRIDGTNGVLEYCGYSIHELAELSSFDEVAFLLHFGHLPDAAQRQAFQDELSAARALPASVAQLMRDLRHAHPVEAVRTGVSALGGFDPHASDPSAPARRAVGVRLLAQIPLLIATHHAARSGRALVTPDAGLPLIDHLLWMLKGEAPSALEVRLMNCDFVVHADHSSNASTFAARVATGCQVDMYGVITAAIATFAGDLHGGAIERVMDMIDAIGTVENTAAYVAQRRAANLPVMGFGHRVYRTEDPRVRHLRGAALRASQERGDLTGFQIIQALETEMAPYARHGIEANVDLYAGLLYRMLGLPNDLSVPLFIAARMAGWAAHALEQDANNILIRPLLHYSGRSGLVHPARGGAHAFPN
ncbi:MAG TPA: citrate/2-methylcitrate synthase [Telluria sp.]|jgi:citrate synthase